MDEKRTATCAHCGVLVDINDGEAMTIFVSPMSAFIYHGWCFEPALERIYIIVRPDNQEGPYDRGQEDADRTAEGSTDVGGSGVGATEGRHPHDE